MLSESYQCFIQGKEGRVCTPCQTILIRLDQAEAENALAEGGAVGGAGSELWWILRSI